MREKTKDNATFRVLLSRPCRDETKTVAYLGQQTKLFRCFDFYSVLLVPLLPARAVHAFARCAATFHRRMLDTHERREFI
mmetsp:Transcript_11517/g.26334  ORF Transcript_11517/g.26334 Transcript_11517/m.26334 type:complete len:80 (+) Transcript_11517:715-954(+)